MPRHTGLAWPKSDMSKSTFGFMAPVDHRRREIICASRGDAGTKNNLEGGGATIYLI
jgi:hypothetical protein